MVDQLKTTYKLNDGSTKTITNGSGGSHVGTFILNEGVYLQKIDMKNDGKAQ